MSHRQRFGDRAVTATQTPSVDSVTAPRRTVLRGALVAGVAAPLLAACGGSDSTSADKTSADTTGTQPSSSGKPSTGADKPSTGADKPSTGGGSTAIASVSDVPSGGGIILDDPGIVITQPTPGDFKGFSNICTHAGCPLHDVTNGTITCTCHGSIFSIDDGSVVGGPAPTPLPEKAIAVDGQDISLA
ncbi:MAG: Rieske 2Fe-2S domain-containing protein [Nocardioidaceae bacterium]